MIGMALCSKHYRAHLTALAAVLMAGMLGNGNNISGQELSRFVQIHHLTNSEISWQLAAPAGTAYRVDSSSDLALWQGLLTLASTGTNRYTNVIRGSSTQRFYRAAEVSGTNLITGDHLATTNGEVIIHPVNHASFVLGWQQRTIYNDPVGGATPYRDLPRPDLILISHSHGDHFNADTLNAIRKPETVIVTPANVFNSLSAALKTQAVVLTNGSRTNLMDVEIEAVPAYNANHPRGSGNGYVVTIGGKRLYMSGDTGDIPEMRSLPDIDVAFVCVNVPFTMSVSDAASAIRDFRPKVVYPYHYRNQNQTLSDLNALKREVGSDVDVEVRVRKWY